MAALLDPRKSTAAYIAPKRFSRSCCLALSSKRKEINETNQICKFRSTKTEYKECCPCAKKEIDLHFLSFVPEDKTKNNGNDNSHGKSDKIVLRVSPIRPMLFPETSLALSEK